MLTQFIKSTTFFQGLLSSPGLFSFRLFVHFIRKVAIRRSLGQRRVLSKSSKLLEN